MKLKIGDWYMLANTMHPEDQRMDRKEVITGLDRKSVFYDEKAGPEMPPTPSFSMSRASFRRHVREVLK